MATDAAVKLPLIWGTDAVHGHNNVRGATLFPHNIGLGATADAKLVEAIGEHHRLRLLDDDAGHLVSAAGLEVEGALPGHADRADDETVGIVELEHLSWHCSTLPARTRHRAASGHHAGPLRA